MTQIGTVPAKILAGMMMGFLALSAGSGTARAAGPIVAAENFYGDVAQQIAGPDAKISSILSNPDQDPHLFEADPATARRLSAAGLVIDNGAGYDPWIDKLLAASPRLGRVEITMAALLHTPGGANPHLWYDTNAMKLMARTIATKLEAGGADRAGTETRLQAFLSALARIDAKIAEMRPRLANLPVTATEPVAGYMVQALGMAMRNQPFQLAVMNNTEPSATDVAAFEDDLRGHKVKLMLFNKQASDNTVERLRKLAEQSGIPVVGVTETEPAGQTYQVWMMNQLTAIDTALSGQTAHPAKP